MQPTLYPKSPSPFPKPRIFTRPSEIRRVSRITHLGLPPSLPKSPTLTCSLRTPVRWEEGFDAPETQSSLELPLAVKSSGNVCRYVWRGGCLELVRVVDDVARGEEFGGDWFGELRRVGEGCVEAVKAFFLPKQVSGNYLQYVKWKLLHRVFSSALQVLATQAMFRAIGIGYSRALPSAAALNWVLKDGLGRLSRCVYTASFASAFDTNLKRVRFSTSIIFSLSIGIELLTPIFPQYFLLVASTANIAKQISLACYLATGSSVHRSFAVADNLGEVAAKAQIQTVCFDNLGLLLAASLNVLVKNNERWQAALPFVVYPLFTALDLFGIYQGLGHVQLQTLTKGRLEIILNKWIDAGYVPTPAEVSREEGIDLFGTRDKKPYPIRLGTLFAKAQIPKSSMMAVQSISFEDVYFVCLETLHSQFSKHNRQNILLCLREGAGITDTMMGLLQACHIRKALLDKSRASNRTISPGNVLELESNEWFNLVEDSKRSASKDLHVVSDQITAAGWATKNILLSTQEQARYSFLDDRTF
ncbi:hypothetical protein MLD38_003149 [Melastoma candidum]|uniref:Uncharacterized protein n=1 Tax=Melastoma candidum TaxID=119954 RepID=A0ACB9SA79_9MYRT|nr:hypothetical protein MLD38_003149 [Melastoma candidum]